MLSKVDEEFDDLITMIEMNRTSERDRINILHKKNEPEIDGIQREIDRKTEELKSGISTP